jgi:hypothetical protein
MHRGASYREKLYIVRQFSCNQYFNPIYNSEHIKQTGQQCQYHMCSWHSLGAIVMQPALQFCCAHSAVLLRTTNDVRDVLSVFYGSREDAMLRSKTIHLPQFRRVRVQINYDAVHVPKSNTPPKHVFYRKLKAREDWCRYALVSDRYTVRILVA